MMLRSIVDKIPADKTCEVCRVELRQEYVDFWSGDDGLIGEFWSYRCPSCGKSYCRVLLPL